MYKRCLTEQSEISLIKENDLLTNSPRSKINKPSPGVRYNLQISLHCMTYFCNNCTIQSLIVTLREQFICANVHAVHKQQQLSFTFDEGGGKGIDSAVPCEWNKMRLPYDTYVFIPDRATSVGSYLFPNESKIAFQWGVMVVREKVCVWALKIHLLAYLFLCEQRKGDAAFISWGCVEKVTCITPSSLATLAQSSMWAVFPWI